MTIDLVDGKAGKAHIDSDDRGSFNIGTMGPGCYVLNVKNKFALTMDSANSGTVDTGGLIMWGRYAHCTEPETITVENGSQNMKRNDLVVMRYTKTTDKIETASLVVIKGMPAASTPSDPQINEVDEITSTTTIADMPLYRIPLDGITVGTPVPLFNVLAPMSELWDSVTLNMEPTKLSNTTSYWVIDNIVHLCVAGEMKQSATWSSRTIGTLPKALAPKARILAATMATNGPLSVALEITTAGEVKLNTMGGTQRDDAVSAFVTWKI